MFAFYEFWILRVTKRFLFCFFFFLSLSSSQRSVVLVHFLFVAFVHLNVLETLNFLFTYLDFLRKSLMKVRVSLDGTR